MWSENGHYYDFIPDHMYWDAAKIDAESRNYEGLQGHLATLTSYDEALFIEQNFSDDLGWLGGYQDRDAADYLEPAGGWYWVTGEVWDYTNWLTSPRQPDNAGGSQDYIRVRGGLGWDDTYNTAPRGTSGVDGYFIEYVPEPATIFFLGLGSLALLRKRRT
ncbi:MAG: PEP-CTERM sorting domain-containing protein [Planctomycetota bacterium]